MKKKYLILAGMVTIMEAMLFGCAATPLAGGLGTSDGTTFQASENGSQNIEETQAANTQLGEASDDDLTVNADREAEDTESDGTNGSEGQLPNMVMLDGKLYVDTNETNSMLRCGNMDGAITSMTDGEMPTEDGQSNFGKDIGYQYGMRENRIEICLDNIWHVFAYNENNLEGVSLELSGFTATGGTVTVCNESDQEIIFGEDFSLEMLDQETKEWTYVPIVVDGEWGFESIGLPVSSQETRDWTVDWTWLYGELAPGHYRIVKGILSEAKAEGMRTEGTGPYVKYTLSKEFEIDEMK